MVHGSEPKVLILDDDLAVGELLCDILQQEGYKVTVFTSPKDVLYLARQYLPDVLLLDIMMPEIDGYFVCEYFKKDPELRFTRIIVLTARDTRESKIKCYRAGADVFLGKPFELDELREVVRNNINAKLALDQLLGGLKNQAITDSVTGCYHRKYMERRIAEEIKRVGRHKRPLSLLLIDLDNYQSIHVRYGFSFANEVLRNVAQAIREQIREPDLLGKYEDDAFIMMLPETGRNGGRTAAKRINDIISSLVFIKKKRFSIRATIVVLEVEPGTRPEDTMAQLEDQLTKIRAKRVGKKA